jgi:hypothetical protein
MRVQGYGLPGVGKSTFGLTFPPPFYIWNGDRDMRGLFAKLPKTHEINYVGLSKAADQFSRAAAAGAMAEFDKLLVAAEQAPPEGTFMIDGADLWWDIIKAWKLPDDPQPKDYQDANNFANDRLRRLTETGLHLYLSSPAKPVWVSASQQSGRVTAEGFKHRSRWITTEVRLFTPESRDETPVTPAADAKPGLSFRAYIGICKEQPGLAGTVINDLTFKKLYTYIYEKTPPEAEKLWSPS